VFDPASSPASELSARIDRLMTTLGERLTHLDREVLREAVRRAGEREGVVEALLDRNLQWGVQLERNRLLEEVAGAALALRQGERGRGRSDGNSRAAPGRVGAGVHGDDHEGGRAAPGRVGAGLKQPLHSLHQRGRPGRLALPAGHPPW
jgi:hypothetical protein